MIDIVPILLQLKKKSLFCSAGFLKYCVLLRSAILDQFHMNTREYLT